MQAIRGKKSFFLVTLVALMLCLTISGGAEAGWNGSAQDISTGNGTSTSPYWIGSPGQLKKMAEWVNAGINADKYYKLVIDIDLENNSWTPIGSSSKPFSGNFDGDGKIISNLKISTNNDNQGLFGYVSGSNAVIKNVGVVGIDISGKDNVGGLAGSINSYSKVQNSFAMGKVAGQSNVGGLIGFTDETKISGYSSVVERSFATCSVTGAAAVGGFVGKNDASLENCYSTGSAIGGSYIGGFVGVNGGRVGASYATGRVKGDSYFGGFFGSNSASAMLSSKSYWVIQGTGMYSDIGNRRFADNLVVIGKAQDFCSLPANGSLNNSIWQAKNGDYPQLRVFSESSSANLQRASSISARALVLGMSNRSDAIEKEIKPLPANSSENEPISWTWTPEDRFQMLNDNVYGKYLSVKSFGDVALKATAGGFSKTFSLTTVQKVPPTIGLQSISDEAFVINIDGLVGLPISAGPNYFDIFVYGSSIPVRPESLSVSAPAKPEWMTITPLTRQTSGLSGTFLITGTPTVNNIGSSSFTVTVTASNEGGSDKIDFKVNYNITATVPEAPQNFTATPGDGQVDLSWTAPANNGGSPITGYKVSKNGGNSWVSLTNVTTYSFTNLSNGQQYNFQVRAVNSVGEGPASQATATPQAAETAPGAPQNLTATPDGEQVDLSWTAPANNGGSPITGYKVSKDGGNSWVSLANVTTYSFTNLSNGQQYNFQVRAVNSVGEGPASQATATPLAAETAPGAPQNFTVTPGYEHVALSWTAPESNGGSGIIGYQVSKDGGTSWENADTDTSHSFSGLSNGQQYNFQVRAVNRVGEGPVSQATAAPHAAAAAPGAPQNFTATP
ncbi:MAG: fibronectin type III domain-containing protein, partial [Synergistaceae bacterium]|nr:fibronectin type III domain-containing protein [Synergistaceae bacterium]